MSEEIVSDVILKLLRKKHALLKIKNFENYLFIMVKNHALNLLKIRSKEKANVQIDQIQDYLVPYDSNPEMKMINNDLAQVLDDAISKLPPKRRLVFLMIKDENMSYKQAADILEISERTVEVHLRMAMSDLRKSLKGFYDRYHKKKSHFKSSFSIHIPINSPALKVFKLMPSQW